MQLATRRVKIMTNKDYTEREPKSRGREWSSGLKSLGPGLLFAGAAVGTSHIVQSTRAGAEYGLGLLPVIILAIVLKYPAFWFGPFYVGTTGNSLIEGYQKTFGKPVVGLFILLQAPIMTMVTAAMAITTAGIAGSIFSSSLEASFIGTTLILACSLLTFFGGYKVIEKLNKFFIITLSLGTLTATALVLPNIQWSFSTSEAPLFFSLATFATIIAVTGLMPSDITLSINNSLWSAAKNKTQGRNRSVLEEKIDFNSGYIGTAVLAVCFLLMGSGLLHGQNVDLSGGAVGFASQVISIYSSLLGKWIGYLVALSMLAVMFTTLMAVLDGFPRILTASYFAITNSSGDDHETRSIDKSLPFFFILLSIATSASLVINFMMGEFITFMNFVMTLVFIASPILATLNHFTVNGKTVEKHKRPGRLMNYWSLLAIISLTLLSIGFFYVRLFL